MRILNKKIFSLVFVFLLTLSSVPFINVQASSISEQKQVLINYLNAVQSLNYDSIVKYSEDSRTPNQQAYIESLKQSLANQSEKISKFKILDTSKSIDANLILIAEIKFEDGSVSNVPFKLVNKNDTWIVSVGSDIADTTLYSKVKKGNDDKIKASSIAPEVTALSQVTTWACWLGGDEYDTKYTGTFSMNYSLTLNFRQYNDYPVASSIQYAIVTYHWYGDDVHAAQTVTGDNPGSAKQITLTPGVYLTGVCIRVSNNNYSTPTYTYGEAYN